MKQKIAIIGAGLSGLILANRLAGASEVEVFEKSRGLGGRMATRRFEEFSFDHGAQFFTARNEEFKRFLAPFLASGLVKEWKGKIVTLEKGNKPGKRLWFEPHYVCCPGMNALCKKLGEGISVRTLAEVAPLQERQGANWNLTDTQGNSLGSFDQIISTAPPAQTSRLFGKLLPTNEQIRKEKLLACYALMIGMSAPWEKSWIAAKVKNSPLDWISVNSTKPNRNHGHTELVIHTSNLWAEKHVEMDQEEVKSVLLQELSSLLDLDFDKAAYTSLHRWRYALLDKDQDEPHSLPPYYDSTLGLGSVGDWCTQSRIEQVWLDANRFATQLILSC
jgi:renalase